MAVPNLNFETVGNAMPLAIETIDKIKHSIDRLIVYKPVASS
jgi:hypothetical protein